MGEFAYLSNIQLCTELHCFSVATHKFIASKSKIRESANFKGHIFIEALKL